MKEQDIAVETGLSAISGVLLLWEKTYQSTQLQGNCLHDISSTLNLVLELPHQARLRPEPIMNALIL
jgi:hypothetical protein